MRKVNRNYHRDKGNRPTDPKPVFSGTDVFADDSLIVVFLSADELLVNGRLRYCSSDIRIMCATGQFYLTQSTTSSATSRLLLK